MLIGKKFFSPADGKALVFGTVMRNLTIALGLAVSLFGKDGTEIALIIALAFIIQVQGAAWYVKLTPKIFNDKDKEKSVDNVENTENNTETNTNVDKNSTGTFYNNTGMK